MQGKYLSVFGASMCTYDGYSNNTDTNSTIGDNAQYYGSAGSANVTNKSLSVDDTFWMQIINEFEMNLLVNNSWSGSKILDTRENAAGYKTRPMQLHADRGVNAGKNPDVILSYMGCNDFNSNTTAGTINDALFTTIQNYVDNDINYVPTTFAEGYIMMVYKMTKAYPDAEIFLFNIGQRTATPSALLLAYNEIIDTVANYYGCYVMDLVDSVMSGTNYNDFTIGDNQHPNAAGMDVWTDLIIEKFKECYVDNK